MTREEADAQCGFATVNGGVSGEPQPSHYFNLFSYTSAVFESAAVSVSWALSEVFGGLCQGVADYGKWGT